VVDSRSMLKQFAPILYAAVLCAGPLLARNVVLTSTSKVVGRTLFIEGSTDLPDSAVIEWELRHESLFKRRDIPISRMAHEGHTVVRGHRYYVSIDLSNWPSGEVEVWVAFQPLSYGTRQPASVNRLYGLNGEWIEGAHVSIHPAHMRRVELIDHVRLSR
jgi:hypothetical protein